MHNIFKFIFYFKFHNFLLKIKKKQKMTSKWFKKKKIKAN